jgi:2-polyprenyl-3-methyl-5-hydroxy-6-metoxy-1,4-benzoquinol methylase
MRVDFDRERQWWDAKAPKHETDLQDEAINRALRWLEIERHLDAIETILCVGAGTGTFSIPLAQRGFSVTHLDFSPRMLDIARERARGVQNIELVRFDREILPDGHGTRQRAGLIAVAEPGEE